MKTFSIIAAVAATFFVTGASAQDMKCSEYLKMDKQAAAQMSGAGMSTGDAKMDAASAAMDKKMHDYCTKNPGASMSKAAEEAMK